jgi:ribosomal protein S8
MADESTIVIEFKAKYDEVTKGFNEVSKGSEKVHAETKKMEQGFGELGAKVHEGANSILNEWLGLV